jgi:hypothetical protein
VAAVADPQRPDQAGDAGAWSAATDDLSRPARSPAAESPAAVSPGVAEPPAGPEHPRSIVTKTPASRPGIREAPPGGAGRPATRRPEPGPAVRTRPQPHDRQRGPDSPAEELMAGLQRWLIRSSARTARREIKGQVRRTLGGGRAESRDVWGTATTEPPPDLSEAPECAWCPVCRAARRMRDNGPGLGPQLTGASDVVASAVQDALRGLDGVLSRAAASGDSQTPADRSQGHRDADSAASDAAERAADHEPGDRG